MGIGAAALDVFGRVRVGVERFFSAIAASLAETTRASTRARAFGGEETRVFSEITSSRLTLSCRGGTRLGSGSKPSSRGNGSLACPPGTPSTERSSSNGSKTASPKFSAHHFIDVIPNGGVSAPTASESFACRPATEAIASPNTEDGHLDTALDAAITPPSATAPTDSKTLVMNFDRSLSAAASTALPSFPKLEPVPLALSAAAAAFSLRLETDSNKVLSAS